MNSNLISFYLLGGVAALYLGAECLIKGGASFAHRFGLSILVISLTILGYGTGMPELIVSIQATLADKGDIALGNVIGSNIANTGLVLGLAAIIRPISLNKQLAKFDSPIMLIATFTLCVLTFMDHNLARWKGLLFLIGFLIYTVSVIYLGKKEAKLTKKLEEEAHVTLLPHITIDLVVIIIGFLFLFYGGHLFLQGAIALAKIYQISDAIIGLSVIAIGTSMPELATSFVAMIKNRQDIAIGNIIGSNIFNILAILGIAATLNPIEINEIKIIDYGTMAALTCFVVWKIHRGTYITRLQGVFLISVYLSYIFYIYQIHKLFL